MDNSKIIYVDLETTGLDVNNDRICQIGAVLPGGEQMDLLVNPEMNIPAESTKIHHITNEMVIDAPILSDVADQVIASLEKAEVFVAYNFMFDFQVLQNELFRTVQYSLNESDFTFIDPFKIFNKMFPRTLANAYQFYTGEKMENAHNALADILATKRVLEEQEKAYPDLFDKGIEEVSRQTIGSSVILGKWFTVNDENVIFTRGKHKGEVVGFEHESYLKWIYNLDDSTNSERRYISDMLGKTVQL